MDPRPNRSTTTTPSLADVHVLPAAPHTTAEPPPGEADPNYPEVNEADGSLPLGVKLTGYRLLNLVVLLAIGFAKFLLSLKGQSIAPTGLEWFGGSVFAALSYWVGLYEVEQPPRWKWFLHVDLAPGIGFASKCFLAGVLQAFATCWEVLPFFLFIYVPFLVPVALWGTSSITIGIGLFSMFLTGFLAVAFPEKWRVWKGMWVWAPIRRFFRKYGSDYSRRYRLVGKTAFVLGFLSGIVMMGLLPYVPALQFL